MPHIVHLHNVEIESVSHPHADLPADMQIFAQLIIEKHISLQTVPLKPEPGQNTWKLKPGCIIPEHAGTFILAIMRHSKSHGTRLLGSIEIDRAFCFDLTKVNSDGPTLRLTADFSVSESLHTQRYKGIEVLGSQSKIL
ncbi:hypothetical protein K438DRAFT_1778748 [Mycena galopus ATCC 62051]|nr:hypothetical protein K438DRAFT_1778748 [Mycena galopus ATCC 62051]